MLECDEAIYGAAVIVLDRAEPKFDEYSSLGLESVVYGRCLEQVDLP